jgi:hypothetical protein
MRRRSDSVRRSLRGRYSGKDGISLIVDKVK